MSALIHVNVVLISKLEIEEKAREQAKRKEGLSPPFSVE